MLLYYGYASCKYLNHSSFRNIYIIQKAVLIHASTRATALLNYTTNNRKFAALLPDQHLSWLPAVYTSITFSAGKVIA